MSLILLLSTKIILIFSSKFLSLENISFRQRLRVYQLKALKLSAFNLHQRISSISLGKEKIESNFIIINGDLNWKKKNPFYRLR